jgi:hypothetical protein
MTTPRRTSAETSDMQSSGFIHSKATKALVGAACLPRGGQARLYEMLAKNLGMSEKPRPVTARKDEMPSCARRRSQMLAASDGAATRRSFQSSRSTTPGSSTSYTRISMMPGYRRACRTLPTWTISVAAQGSTRVDWLNSRSSKPSLSRSLASLRSDNRTSKRRCSESLSGRGFVAQPPRWRMNDASCCANSCLVVSAPHPVRGPLAVRRQQARGRMDTAVSVRDKVKDPERQRLAPSLHERRLRRQPDCRRTLPLATLDRENAEQLIQRERTGSVQAQ